MLESKFGVLFRHWLKANPTFSQAYELKQTASDSIPFSALEDHQALYLQAIKSNHGTLIRVQGSGGEPDYVYLRNCPASVVIKYPKEFSIIDIDTFLLERSRSKRKSLIASRARELSTVTVSTSNVR
jgi:hypothetical protein